MPRICSICAHPDKEAIDRALAAGEAAAKIAGRYRTIDERAIRRHRSNHLPEKLVKAQEQEDVRQALDVVKTLRVINDVSLSILKEARASSDPGLALRAIDRIQRQIELQAKLLGELDDAQTVNILLSPQWLEIRTAIVEVLAPYPEARSAVAERLMEVG
jgi:hypothetical protein